MFAALLSTLMLSTAAEAAPAPEIKLRDLSNQERTLSAEQGKVVLVNFWATWCAPCMVEMPHIQQMYDDLADIEKMIAKNEKEPEPKAQEPVAPTQQSPNEPKDNQEIS